ncbi:class I SAM-dependent methyltransferase [Endozoicomonas ascidiicola]|uniref:class I SAM-dependent methyltransferase n=1 Tax=Endozoicomonas ascidiicola TaxID=1698521 RepID=UPI000830B861|nr:class I SAM-dependent methyltransferase [Endozoicomonas ascidiicola]
MDDIFQDHWRLYQKILNEDYMGHREIASFLQQALAPPLKQLRVLELGCGDGDLFFRLTPRVSVGHYVGVDITEFALNIFKERLNEKDDLPVDVRLHHRDMLSFLTQCDDQFDVIVAGYCVHHLSADDKQQLLMSVLPCLKSGGQLFLYDLFLKDTHDKNAYIRDYMAEVRQRWMSLSESEQVMVESHISECDFPETVSSYREWAEGVGYDGFAQVWQGEFWANKIIRFQI